MQYPSKLKKDTVQVLRTERTENTNKNDGAASGDGFEGDKDAGSRLMGKEKRTREASASAPKEVVSDAAETGTSEKFPDAEDVDNEQAADEAHSHYDPYKCDIDADDNDDEEREEYQDEDEENDETFTPAKQQITKRKRGRPPKVPPGGAGAGSSHSNSARKSSRLKLVRKAIAKVKKDKTNNSSSSHGNSSHSKPLEKPKCAKCDYVAPSVEKLEQHVKRAHKDDTVYACAVCGYTCAWNREYYRHMKRHFRGPPYECDFEACDYVVDRIQPLLYHRMVRFSSKETVC